MTKNFTHTYNPHQKRILSFNSLQKIFGESFHPWGHERKSWNQNLLSPDLHQKQKDEILDSPCVPKPRIKPGRQKARFQSALNNTSAPSYHQPTTSKLPFLGLCKKILNPPSCPQNLHSFDLHQKQEGEILDSPCTPYPWIETGTQTMRFQPALNKNFCSKPTIRTLQTTKITKFCLLSLPPLVLTRRFTISEWKSQFIFSLPGKRSPADGLEL